jgi:hypothetical protein
MKNISKVIKENKRKRIKTMFNNNAINDSK